MKSYVSAAMPDALPRGAGEGFISRNRALRGVKNTHFCLRWLPDLAAIVLIP